MPLNPVKGNMYNFISHTWNAIKGKCIHDCNYCYMKRFPQKEIRLDEKEFRTNLGRHNIIFVGSSTDMFAENVPKEWIIKVLNHCNKYPENTYLFQSKNPMRFIKLRDKLISMNCILGTTIETNRQEELNKLGSAPSIHERSDAMTIKGFRKMVTIEPVIDFDVIPLVSEIRRIAPEFVNIGGDSGGNKLPEPSEYKLENLIKELNKFTKVNSKRNIERLMPKLSNVKNTNKGGKDAV